MTQYYASHNSDASQKTMPCEVTMTFDKSQLLRGTLEGCILKIISKQTTYGYEILESLRQHGFTELSEGTIYPILLRLEKQGNLKSQLLPSPLGPKRKYFSITAQGLAYLSSFEESWMWISRLTQQILAEEEAP